MVFIKFANERFEIDKEKINNFPNTTLAAAVRFNSEKEEFDFSFRSPTLFGITMDLYNTGKLSVPREVTYASLKEELCFWGFELVEPIQKRPDAFSLFEVQPSKTLACPWGVYSRALGSACWVPLVCFVWNTILASPVLIETAALGYNDINIFIRHSSGDDSVGVSLLMSHRRFLTRLAELSACQVAFIDGVYGQDVHREARTQDLLTSRRTTINSWRIIHDQQINGTCSLKGGVLTMAATAPTNITFHWKGFDVNVDMEGTTLFWDCTCRDAEKEDPLYVQDVSGFLLRISFVVDDHIIEGFLIPSTKQRYMQTSIHSSKSQGFTIPPNNPAWYKETGSLTPQPIPLNRTRLHHVTSIVLLVEEATRGILEVEHIGPDLDVPYGVFFERLNICF